MNCGGYLFKLGRSDSNSKESSVWKRGGSGGRTQLSPQSPDSEGDGGSLSPAAAFGG